MTLWEKLQRVDSRLLYLLLLIIVALPFVSDKITGKPIPVPAPAIAPETQGFYDTIEKIAADPVASKKLVLFSANYGAGTQAESGSQAEAVMRHLMKRKLKFALFTITDPQGSELGQRVADKLSNQYGYVYGRDYVNWGFRPSGAAVTLLKAAVRDIPGTVQKDRRQQPIASYPVMRNIKTSEDIAAIIEVTGSNSLDIYIQYFQRAGKTPIPTLYCPTSVMAPEAFPLLSSGQLQGMTVGLKGAIEYEALLKEPGFATQASASLSYAHFLIIAMIILGNIAMFASRKSTPGAAPRTETTEGGR